MQYLRQSNIYSVIFLSLFSTLSYAEDIEQENNSVSIENPAREHEQAIREIQPNSIKKLSTTLPSDVSQNYPKEQVSKEESIQYLLTHPVEFESLLGTLLTRANAEALEELLPYYQKVPNYDPSVVDWGRAIIKAKNGELDEAVTIYRAINAKLPDIKILRFQMAQTLFYNRQFAAAQSEFEKLRSSTTAEADIQVINNYLEAINKQDSWDFSANLSYINDHNITNTAKSTKHKRQDGSSVITSSRESGEGFNFGLYGDKKWFYDNKIFTALHLNSYGNYYWDNKNFNDVTAGIGTGIGYQNATTEVEVGPFYDKLWYGQGKDGDGDIHTYADTVGTKITFKKWLSPNWRYQGLLRNSKTKYIDKYNLNNSKDMLFANTMLYAPSAKQFWAFGIDYSNKKADLKSKSYNREGVRLVFGQTWSKGYSTTLNLSAAKRNYEGPDVFGNQYRDKEYNAGVTFWNRSFSLFTLTPKLNYNYRRVDSNTPYREYDKHDVSVELTKTF